MRLLPILWGKPPAEQDWRRLGDARIAIGYPDKIMPARAVHGSPGRVLAIGAEPDWLCEFIRVDDTLDAPKLEFALKWALEAEEGLDGEDVAEKLASWMGVEVTFKGMEEINAEAQA